MTPDSSATDLVTIGEVLMCLAPDDGQSLRSSEVLHASLAGAEANTAIGLARLGCAVRYVGLLADDPYGLRLRAELAAENVDVAGLRLVPGRTGLILKERTDPHCAVSRYYRESSPAALMTTDELDLDVVAHSKRLHMTGITCALGDGPREVARTAILKARAAGTAISLDLNVRPGLWSAGQATAELRALLPFVDEVLCNQDEAQLLVGPAPVPALLGSLAAFGPRAVVVKRGPSGAAALVDGYAFEVPAWPAPRPIDPVGAGDAFNAGWLFGRLRGLPVAVCLVTGAWVAAAVVQSARDADGPDLRQWYDDENAIRTLADRVARQAIVCGRDAGAR